MTVSHEELALVSAARRGEPGALRALAVCLDHRLGDADNHLDGAVAAVAGGSTAPAPGPARACWTRWRVVVLSVKARFEEGLLAHRFAGYPAYASSTPRFVPRLRRRQSEPPSSPPPRPDAGHRPPIWSR